MFRACEEQFCLQNVRFADLVFKIERCIYSISILRIFIPLQLMSDINLSQTPQLDNYQERFVNSVAKLLQSNYFSSHPKVRILDSGCDTSGRQLWHLKQLTRGEVVGVNPEPGFPSSAAINTAGERTQLVSMDGMQLDFPDESFDLVVSANVIEHVANTGAYIAECARVLKPSGVAYIETAPLWTSARGHHIMESMVNVDCPTEKNYRDDGTIIPDWGHLGLDEQGMCLLLDGTLQAATREYILRIIYRSDVLNKTPWRTIRKQLDQAFPFTKITTWPIGDANLKAVPQDGMDDYLAYGFSCVGRKRKLNGLARRLFWRLRKHGF